MWKVLLLVVLGGCFFGRVDYEVTRPEEDSRFSATVWTIGKNYDYADPNTWFQSTSDKINFVTPAIAGSTE
jgi:hypothetical protein